MSDTADTKTETETETKPKHAYAKSWDTAQTVFKLISKHRTSADPISYAVWFSYAAGRQPELNAALDAVLEESGGISLAEMQHLHTQFVAADAQTDEDLDDISRAIRDEVADAQSLVTDIISNTDDYVSSMDKAKNMLPANASQEELSSAIGGIIEQTESSKASAQSIQVALKSKHDEITQLSSKIITFRENLMRDNLTELVNQQRFEALLGEHAADALANGYSLTVLAASIKNIQDLNQTANMDISEFILKSFSDITRRVVGDQGVCGRFSSSFFGIMLPRAAYADAGKVANAIIEELDLFKIVKKPSDQLVGYIDAAFGGTSLRVGSSPRELVAQAIAQAQKAKLSERSTIKFDLAPQMAAEEGEQAPDLAVGQ
nr:GGDEF domain-containing protein [Hyphomonas sp. Mor2]